MLIIYAHFSRSGHNGQVLSEVEKFLKEKVHLYEILDLYQIDFDPILTNQDILSREKFSSDEKIRSLQEKILQEQEFIFIYPTWWNNVPAMLKGFYDRVLAAGFAFRYQKNGLPEGLLKGKRALVFTTTGGPAFYQKLVRGTRSIKVTTSDTLEFCGLKTQSVLIGGCRSLDEKKKLEIQKKVAKAMEKFTA